MALPRASAAPHCCPVPPWLRPVTPLLHSSQSEAGAQVLGGSDMVVFLQRGVRPLHDSSLVAPGLHTGACLSVPAAFPQTGWKPRRAAWPLTGVTCLLRPLAVPRSR